MSIISSLIAFTTQVFSRQGEMSVEIKLRKLK